MTASADANRIAERLGPRTGIAVRTSKKYLTRAGIEVVPAPAFRHPDAFVVYFMGAEAGRVEPARTQPPADLVARVLRLAADAARAARPPATSPASTALPLADHVRHADDVYEGWDDDTPAPGR